MVDGGRVGLVVSGEGSYGWKMVVRRLVGDEAIIGAEVGSEVVVR